MIRRILTTLTLAATLVASSLASASNIVVASWNVKRLGQGNQQSLPMLAAVASKADLVALQEVMTAEGLARFEKALEKHTGEEWSSIASHAVGRSSYKEMYAFVWRESAVAYAEGAAVYIDPGDKFIREPFSARFESRRDGSQIALATVHILFGKGISDRTPEIKALAHYWEWMGETYPGTPRMLVGDFNLPPDNPAWAPLRAMAKPLITQGATTLSSKDGRYANLYDNIWVDKGTKLKLRDAGIIDFPRMIGWNHEKSRRHVSDHAPVFVTLGSAVVGADVARVSDNSVRSGQKALAKSAAYEKASTGAVRGNKNSMIYHRPDCPSYNRISAKNRVEFKSEAQAKAAGYRIAGNCR